MTELQTNGPGTVMIAEDALAVIAGTAALETEGVAGLAGHFTNKFAEAFNRKHMAKGVAVTVDGASVRAAVDLTVKFGAKVQDVSREVQQKIKTAIETMTGLTVAEVNVNVSAVTNEKQRGA